MSDIDRLALLDANILVYAEQGKSPYHEASRSLRDRALTGETVACVSPQVLNEFYAIVTNPDRVDELLTRQEAIAQIRKYHQAKHLIKIYPGPTIIDRELALLGAHPVTGPDIHLVATMLENGIERIYTFNTRDFAPFSEVEALVPPASASASEPHEPAPSAPSSN